MVTEPESITTDKPGYSRYMYVNLGNLNIFESTYTSYTHFIKVNKLVFQSSVYKDRIENSHIRWVPDFGTWPNILGDKPVNYIDPYKTIRCGFYDDGKGFNYREKAKSLGSISNGDYVAYYNLDFGDGCSRFKSNCSSGSWGGLLNCVWTL